jgi:hypothetical protein
LSEFITAVYTCTWIRPLGHIAILSQLRHATTVLPLSTQASELPSIGYGVGVVGNSRCCFSTASGVDEKDERFESSSLSLFGVTNAGTGMGAGTGRCWVTVVERESTPLGRSFEKSEGRFAGGGGTAARGEPSGASLGAAMTVRAWESSDVEM